MENQLPEDEKDEGLIDKIKKLPSKITPKIGDTGSQKEYAKNPLAVVGFWLMTALATVLAFMIYSYSERAEEAEKNVVIERAKRDADKENNEARVDKWIKIALDATKENGKKEQLNELNTK